MPAAACGPQTAKLPCHAPAVGALVQVRARRWLVEEVVEPPAPDESSIVRLACAEDDSQGQSLDAFLDYELDWHILEDEGWADLAAKGLDSPRQFAAFLHTLRRHCVTATDPSLFQSPFRAGIRIGACQMEPLRKALRLLRVNLFISDDTGLGKTIEAGLIARERRTLRNRDQVHSCDSRPRRTFQAQPVPFRNAAQRPLEQLLDPAGAATTRRCSSMITCWCTASSRCAAVRRTQALSTRSCSRCCSAGSALFRSHEHLMSVRHLHPSDQRSLSTSTPCFLVCHPAIRTPMRPSAVPAICLISSNR